MGEGSYRLFHRWIESRKRADSLNIFKEFQKKIEPNDEERAQILAKEYFDWINAKSSFQIGWLLGCSRR